jgi:ABC-type cobalamin/Fe3+-siderophores transport system ATPase subunit
VTAALAALAADGLGKRYGRRWALSDCTLQVPPGRVVGLVGPNGAGKTTLLHLVTDLERVCDHLVVLAASRVQVAGDVDDLLAAHCRLTGPRRDAAALPASCEVIDESHTDVQSSFIVRGPGPVYDPAWTVEELSLEDVVLAYMSRARHGAGRGRRGLSVLR